MFRSAKSSQRTIVRAKINIVHTTLTNFQAPNREYAHMKLQTEETEQRWNSARDKTAPIVTSIHIADTTLTRPHLLFKINAHISMTTEIS